MQIWLISKRIEVFPNKSFVLPELFFRIWWRRQKWCGRCSPCPVGLCRVWGSCATCSSLDRL